MREDAMTRCRGQNTTNGQPCKATALPGRDYCFAHDPETRDRHRKGAQLGAAQSGRYGPTLDVAGVDVGTLDGLRELLARALKQLANLPFNERAANAMAVLAAQLRAILQDADLERRLAALEKQTEQQASAADGKESWQ